jgi:threonine aldolase
MIDLRSDTVTRPTPAMRRAMAEAEVGDDVYGEDPTINRLEQRAADLMGKEAALFVPTGTMGNTIGIKLHTEHGQEVVCDSRSHVFDWELSMVAWFSGCVLRTVSADRELPRWQHYRTAIRAGGNNSAPTGCITVENTHNMLGGLIYPVDALDEICHGTHRLGLKVHLDGARIFNAAVSLGVSPARICRDADTVMFCLSKGLGAPVGSLLAGSASDMLRGRRLRKRLGGGMRQAGVLAAAGLVALEESPAKLATDHENARLFASLLGLPTSPPTNIVVFDVSYTGRTPAQIAGALKAEGVLVSPVAETVLRAVTHQDVSAEECRAAAGIVRRVLTSGT